MTPPSPPPGRTPRSPTSPPCSASSTRADGRAVLRAAPPPPSGYSMISGYELAAQGLLRYFQTHGLLPGGDPWPVSLRGSGPGRWPSCSSRGWSTRSVCTTLEPCSRSSGPPSPPDLPSSGWCWARSWWGSGSYRSLRPCFGPLWRRTVSLVGLVVLGAAGLASAFSPTWPILAVLRGLAGVGAAMFFSPALGLIASYPPSRTARARDRVLQRGVQHRWRPGPFRGGRPRTVCSGRRPRWR